PSELAGWLEVYGAAARALTAMGHPRDALTFHEAQLRIADLILDRDPDHAGATWVRTSTEQKMGALAWQTDDTERSIRHLEAAIAKYRAFAAGGRLTPDLPGALCRSEERRVGKECRSRCEAHHATQNPTAQRHQR